ncbi:Thoeris anti-defense Tad2 family protein [Xenorhabdus bharatensis]|uniref:Thoeris anti-defense Tad2 family protein n=1 Tax=Xenorhabdus bharatensis TaxID=3136256 RepID=UPI0030F43A2F
MSDVNKLDDKQCPFDPEQYKKKVDVEVDGIPPVGSLPWALIQVYLGKVLSRSKWNTNEYIQLSAKNDDSEPVHIEKHDKNNIPQAWEPTPEDLMACDWSFLKIKPVECMLSFDLKVGTNNNKLWTEWGYSSDDYGSLTILENKVDIKIFSEFISDWDSNIGIAAASSPDQDGYQKVKKLLQSDTTVIVDGIRYHLGSATENAGSAPPHGYSGFYGPNNKDAEKLAVLLQQNSGKTLHFCFNWK